MFLDKPGMENAKSNQKKKKSSLEGQIEHICGLGLEGLLVTSDVEGEVLARG